MFFPSTHDECIVDYGTEMNQILHALNMSKSKHKFASNLDSLFWGYDWAVNIAGGIKEDVFFIVGSIGKWRHYLQIKKEPNVILAFREKAESERKLEKAQILHLSPEEKDDRISDILSELNGSSGFFAFGSK